MKLVIGVVRPDKANDVLEALYRADVRGLSLSRVQGHGGELDRVETYRGTTVKMGLAEKVRFEIAVSEPFVQPTELGAPGFRATFPLLHRYAHRRFHLSRESVAESDRQVEAVFDTVGQWLADGRPCLCGEAFTAADLTFAASHCRRPRPRPLRRTSSPARGTAGAHGLTCPRAPEAPGGGVRASGSV